MATTCPVGFNLDKLRQLIRTEYDRVGREPNGRFHFRRGSATPPPDQLSRDYPPHSFQCFECTPVIVAADSREYGAARRRKDRPVPPSCAKIIHGRRDGYILARSQKRSCRQAATKVEQSSWPLMAINPLSRVSGTPACIITLTAPSV
jgi:hypothetical protein